MSPIQLFNEKALLLIRKHNRSWELLSEIKQKYIFEQVRIAFGIDITKGFNQITLDGYREIYVCGDSFTFISESKQDNMAFSVFTNQDDNLMGLGVKYKNDIIAPHMEVGVEEILRQYNEDEIMEITELVEECIEKLDKPIRQMEINPTPLGYDCYFTIYNKGFQGEGKYYGMKEIISLLIDKPI